MSCFNRRSFLAVASCVALVACKPSVGQAPSLITDYTLLAVRGEPPEARPGSNVTYSFLLASPQGTVDTAEAVWDICQTPKPPSESNSVASACTGAPDAGVGIAGQTFTAPMPTQACRLFGPIAPPPVPGQAAVRPRDPDTTGGFYLPVQVWLPNTTAGAISGFAMERITCNLANASRDIVGRYNNEYTANQDPRIDRADVVDASGNGAELSLTPVPVSANATINLEVVVADGSSEVFPVYDQEAMTLVDQAETLRVSWFASGGSFEHDRTTVESGTLSSGNRWTCPGVPGIYWVWLVLRDSRGGTDFKSYAVEVLP